MGFVRVHNWGGWTEFDMKMNGDAIYFSGVSHDTDTCMTFMNVLRQQQPVEDFPGDILPASTFFFNKRSVTDMQAMLDFTARQEYTTSTYSDYIRDRDGELLAFLKDNAGGELVTCLFHSADTLANPCAVMTIPLKDVQQAERVCKEYSGVLRKKWTALRSHVLLSVKRLQELIRFMCCHVIHCLRN